jgi:hypothetical protein
MATIANYLTTGRYPTPPQSSNASNLCFPTDLVNQNRQFYINLQVASYLRTSVLVGPYLSPGTSITLPIPLKINDTQTVIWEQASLAAAALGIITGGGSLAASFGSKIGSFISNVVNLPGLSNLAGGISDLASYETGIKGNPGLVMLFKNANFKQHNLQWVLAPNNSNDAQVLQSIISILKNGMLPTNYGPILGYPNIIIPSLSVEGTTYKFKPSAITSLSIDWSAGATPAFFNDQNPALVSITMQLTEIELWFNGQV